MKGNQLLVIIICCVAFTFSCGRPYDPESLNPHHSGNYEVVGRLTTPGNAQDVICKDTIVYIAQGEGGLLVANVANSSAPQMLSVTTESVRGYSTRIAMKDSVVYIAAGTYGVTVLNVSNPHSPIVTVSNLNMKPARNLYVFGDYLFTTVSELGVRFAEISYPTQPDIRGGVSTPGYAQGVTTSKDSNLLIVANGEMGLTFFDISDFQIGFGPYSQVGWCDTPGYAELVVVSDNGSLAYVACGNSGVQIIDFSDLSNIHIVGSFYYSGYAKALIYKDQKVYLAARRGGLQVINVANPAKPVLLGAIGTTDALGLDMHDNNIFVADGAEGLIVISIKQ